MHSDFLRLTKPMLDKLGKHGISVATPVQRAIIPEVLNGRDIIAQSETGSGKTLSFAVPLIEMIKPGDGLKALILVPTRELCVQVTNEFHKFSLHRNFAATAVYGGVSMSEQIRKVKRTNVVIATPGRLIDLLDRGAFNLSKVEYLVFDEADRMLDMGFIKDIERILRLMPQKKQTMLFSATISKDISRLSKKYLNDPFRVSFDKPVEPGFLRQTYYQTMQSRKMALLIHLLKNERELTIVFCNRKHITEKLARNLTAEGIAAKCLNGDMTQAKREKVTKEFREKKFSVLIATDVASRGLHIEGISHVYNYEIPKDVESYTHRVGRTARAGKKGEAISLVTPGEDQKFFKQILFMHKGIITLKDVDDALLPGVKEAVKGKNADDEKHYGRNSNRRSDNWKKNSRENSERSYGSHPKRKKFSNESRPDNRGRTGRKNSGKGGFSNAGNRGGRDTYSGKGMERKHSHSSGQGRFGPSDKVYQFDDRDAEEARIRKDIYAGFRDKQSTDQGRKKNNSDGKKGGRFNWFSGERLRSFLDKGKPGERKKKPRK